MKLNKNESESTEPEIKHSTFTNAKVLTDMTSGAVEGIPIFIYALIFGISFGILAQQLNLAYEGLLMSSLWFSGVAQYAVMEAIYNERASLLSIVLMAIIINSRHVIMGISLYPYLNYPKSPLKCNTYAC